MNLTLHTSSYKRILLFAFLIISSLSLHAQDLYINEFMASNGSTIADENGEFDDWVEVYNAGTTAIDIAGMYLTDDTTNTTKWQIPATNSALTTIPAGGFLLLWFDSEPEQGELHIDAKLGAGGEDVGLYAADGISMIDAYTFGPQLEDISEGRVPDAASDWDFYAEPTPGASNDTADPGVELTEIPVADISGGLYPASQIITLTSATPDAEIYYTLDGTDPSDNSIEYTGPITINDISPLRAIAYSATLLPSNVMTETYLIGVEHDFAIVAINTDTVNLYDEELGIFTNFEEDIEAPAHVQFYEPDGTLGFSQDIEIEVFGNASAALPQKSLKLKAKASLGNEFFEYEIFPDQNIEEYLSFVVRQSGQDWNITMFRDAFEQGLFDDIADLNGVLEKPDLDLQGYRPGVVYLNGEYWGIYNVREQMNWKYLNTHYGIEKEEVDIVEDDDELELGDLNEWNSFNNFLENTNFSSDANYQTLREKADVDHYIDYMLHGMIIDNNDWPGNNNKHYRERTADAKWRWLTKDLDFGFGLRPLNSTWNSGDFTTNMLEICLAENSSNYYNPPEATLFLRRLMENDQSKNYFINRAADFLNTIFEPSRVVARIDSLETIYIPEVQAHFDRWQSGYSDHPEDVDVLRTFANGRAPEVRTHFVNYYTEISGTTAVTIDANPSEGGNINFSTLNFTEINYPWDGSYFQGIDIPLSAKPARGFVLDSWSDAALGNDLETIVNINSSSYDLTANFVLGSNATDPIVINEINYNSPDFPNPEDWIELYNPNTTAVDISGWYFEDESGDYFGLPANTILAPGAYLILAEDLESFMGVYPNATNVIASFGQDPGGFGLSGGGELITIKNANGVLIDAVEYDDNSPWPDEPDGDGPTLQLIDPALDNSLASSWQDFDPTPGTLNGVAAVPQDQSINFPEIDDQITFSPPIQLEAVATSGLPISYSIVSGPATVSGSILTLSGTIGTVVVRASQAGNADYYAATDVDQNFYVDEFTGGPEGYCESQGNAPWQEWISNIAFNTIDNPSLKTQYSDFTNIGTFVTQNSNYDITLSPSFSGTVFEEYWSVWIDFNQDSDFDDPGEEVLSVSSVFNNPLTGNITIPSDAELGATRMRIAMKRDAFAEPCETFAKGEVEDYTIFIAEAADVLTFDCPADINEAISGTATDVIITWTAPTGSTTCASGIVNLTQTSGGPSGSAFPIGTTIIEYEATDDCGNIETCSFTISVTLDNGILSITCPSDINTTVPGGATGALITWTEPMPSSSCPLGGEAATQSSGPINGALFPVGETVVSYTATDDCGNLETCSFTVTVTEDFGTLTIACPADINLTISGTATGAIANWTEPIPSTTCAAGGETANQTGGLANGSLFPIGATVVSYTATDGCGNQETCTFTVTVTLVNGDLTINCPTDINLTVSGPVSGATANWVEPIPSTSCPTGGETANQTGGLANGSLFPIGTTVVSYTATDDCGNQETCTFTVTVTLDNGNLTIICPANITETIPAGSTGTLVTWTEPIPSTTCPLTGAIAIQTGGLVNGSFFPVGTTIINYEATDDCGNIETCSFSIAIELDASELTIDCPADVLVSTLPGAANAIASWNDAVAMTSCPQGGLLSGQNGGDPSGSVFPIGNSVISYKAEDDCGNTAGCTFNVIVEATPVDITIDCPTNISVPADASGLGSTVSWTTPAGSTNCYLNGLLVNQTVGDPSGSFFPIGTYTISYEAMDACLEMATCSFEITVTNTSGTISLDCPDNINIVLPFGQTSTTVNWPLPMVSSSCNGGDPNPNCGTTITGFTSLGVQGDQEYFISQTNRPWTAAQADCELYDGYLVAIGSLIEDEFIGNNVSEVIHIGINDATVEGTLEWINGEPVNYTNFTSSSQNTATNDYSYKAPWNGKWKMYSGSAYKKYVMELDCGGGSSVDLLQSSGPANGASLTAGVYTIAYEATDDCGDLQVCNFTITIEENPQSLVIECPNNITVTEESGTGGAVVSWSDATAMSVNCPGAIAVTQTSGDPSGSVFPVGTQVITYTATDACANVETCSFTITVEADSPPSDYCESQGDAPWQQWISNVSFNTINNDSGKSKYGDFTGITTNVDTDASYTISVSPKFSWTHWDEYIRVWIDYNGDFDFDDAGEKVFEAIYIAGPSGSDVPPLTGIVTVPTDAASGPHRMRVAMKKDAFAEPCEVFAFGEVEDYTVEVNFNGSNLEGTYETFFFNAMKNGREVALNWITDTEYKNDSFVVEHSLDGLSFESLAEIESREDVDAQRMYNEVDPRPALGVNFYRLKQIYKDGSFRYSGIKKIIFDIDLESFSLFPNPASDQVFINLEKYQGMEADIQIFNALGQQVLQEQIDEITEHAIRFDVSKYYNGIYTISIKVKDRKRLTKQFVISRLY